jgi:hypothetical protein
VRQLIKKIRYGRNFGGQREDYAGPGVVEALIEAGHGMCHDASFADPTSQSSLFAG